MEEERIIQARIEYGKLINQSKRQAKRSECLWCGKKITRFCNSHSVPQFVLKNIDTDGKIDYFNSMLNLPLINSDKGIAEAGTFKLLCPECDSRIFQDYENKENLENTISQKMLQEIALKNVLMMLNKRFFELELFSNMEQQFNAFYPYEQKQEANSLDERDFWIDFYRIKAGLEETRGCNYNLFFYKKLNYVIPIAFQGIITLYGDLEGKMVTDIYNKSEEIVVNHMHVCLFPLEKESVVMAFYNADDHEYDAFAKQFVEVSVDEQLSILSYIVYQYCEDMLFAKKFPHRTWLINKVRDTFVDTTEILAFDEEHAEYQKRIKLHQLKNRDKDFPCILSEKYSVKSKVDN